jgi:threonine/homoserine/homoserine lactone efflux protein
MENILMLIAATIILVSIPGPNVALIVANSLQDGLRSGLVTVFGTTFGVAIQLALVILGMAAIIETAADFLQWIKWGGVLYLLWLGVKTWRLPASDLDAIQAQPAVFWRACVVAATNPKTLLFNAAFLPQFVGSGATTLQFAFISAVFLVVLLLGDLLWALFANAARPFLHKVAGVRNRVTGAFLILAGVGLALARREL